MQPVVVGVGHADDAVVAELVEVEVVADATAHGEDEVGERLHHSVDGLLVGVERLAAQRQDGLERRVSSVERGAAGTVAFDQQQLFRPVGLSGAVAELGRQAVA